MLVLSMHDEAHYAERALRAGARGYVDEARDARKSSPPSAGCWRASLYFSETGRSHGRERLVGGAARRVVPVEQLSDRELEVFEMLGTRPRHPAN